MTEWQDIESAFGGDQIRYARLCECADSLESLIEGLDPTRWKFVTISTESMSYWKNTGEDDG